MAGTRSSTRRAAANGSDLSAPAKSADEQTAAAGIKRKPDSNSASESKRGRKNGVKEQKTLEETMPDPEEQTAQKSGESKGTKESPAPTHKEDTKHSQNATAENKNESHASDNDGDVSKNGQSARVEHEANGGAVEESTKREESMPSNILEKGIIYFFMRGRVGIDEPTGVQDVARSYFVLRPLPKGGNLTDGAIQDLGNNRLVALPKKVLPKSHRDRFLAFVEKAKTSIKDLKENFLAGSDYDTKTAGTRHTPPVTPVAEGVYALTTTGQASGTATHLAYVLTIPSSLSEVQEDLGLRERGSFVLSVKNPKYPSPPNAALPQGPEYSQEILDEFRSLRWAPLQPRMIDYPNSQMLMIGEAGGDIGKAGEPDPKDDHKEKDTPAEEIEKLEEEDNIRVEHLKGDDTVFEDLDISKKDYSTVQTTW